MQKGILKEGNEHCVFIEGNLTSNCTEIKLQEIVSTIKKNKNIEVVIAFNKKAWQLLEPNWTPEKLQDYKTLNGKKNYSMPSTQADILVWAHTNSKSDLFDFSEIIKDLFEDKIDINIYQEGFMYKDSRDLIGFVDGTGNPKEEKIIDAAVIPQGTIGQGGSYVFTQQWNHNLKAFNNESVHNQEKIVGRTKVEDVELEGDAMPKDSHVSKTDLKVDGEAMKIYRRSYPFANKNEKGLYFLAFTCDPMRINVQLESMLGNSEDNIPDRLMEFSTPVTGSYYFAPSQDYLNNL
jgi:putative iron-dependent peroxidase